MQELTRGRTTETFTYMCLGEEVDFFGEGEFPSVARYQTVQVDPDEELQRLLLPPVRGLWALTGRLLSQRDYLTRVSWEDTSWQSPHEYVWWQLHNLLENIGGSVPVFFGGDDRLPQGVAAILHAHSNYLEWRDTPTRHWILAAAIPVTVRILYNPRTLDTQRLDLGIVDFPRSLADAWPH